VHRLKSGGDQPVGESLPLGLEVQDGGG